MASSCASKSQPAWESIGSGTVAMITSHIDADHAARSEARLRAALERLNGALRGQRYLVGGAFSRADLAICVLLAPLCLPELAAPAVADALPAAVARFRAEQEDAPLFAWVAETYRRHRSPPAD